MKKNIFLLCIVSMLLSLGFSALAASPVPYINMTFDTADLSGIDSYLSSGNAVIDTNGGMLNLTADGSMQTVRAATSRKVNLADSPVVYFDFKSLSNNAIQTFGILSNSSEKNIFTIMNNSLTINSVSYTLDSEKIYKAAVSISEGKVYLVINNEIIYDGTLNSLSGVAEGGIFFKNISLAATSILSVDNIIAVNSGVYFPETNIENEQMLQSFEQFTAVFGTPIIKAEGVLKCDGAEIDTKISFTYDSVTLTSPVVFEESKEYEAVINNIYTSDGVLQNDITVHFMIAPPGYVSPIVTTEPLNGVYRPDDEITVNYNVETNNDIIKTVLFVNGIAVDEKNDSSPFVFLPESGTYTIVIAAYDNIGGSGKSAEQVISVKENTPPEIEFLEITGNVADASLLDNLKVKITDDVFVGSAELYINGELVNPAVTIENDIYTFSKFNYYLGIYPITVKAYDLEGGENEITKTLTVSKSNSSVLTENNFEDGATNTGFSVTAHNNSEFSNVTVKDNNGNDTKAFFMKRISATPANAPYIAKTINGSGVYSIEFDVMLPSLSSAFQINTRGKGSAEYPLNISTSGANITMRNAAETITKSNVITAGKWYNFRYICDVNNFIYWFYLDGEMFTPAEGYNFSYKFAEQTLAELRLQCSLPLNEGIYFDNVKWTRQLNYPSILSAAVIPGGSITLNLASSIDANSVVAKGLPQNVTVYADGKTIEFYKAEVLGNAIKLYSQDIYKDVDYKAVLSKNATFGGGTALGTDAVADISADISGFNITEVRFNSSAEGKLNIEADIQNNGDLDESFYAAVALVNAKGAVEKIISSGKFDIASYSGETFSINNIETNGLKAEIMFINNWSECKALTNRIYKQQ